MSVKKIKLENLEKLLEKLPPDQRDAARTSTLSAFEDIAAGKIQPQVVIPLPDNTKTCPKCNSRLQYPHTMQLPPGIGGALAGELVTYCECVPGDQPYMVKAVQ